MASKAESEFARVLYYTEEPQMPVTQRHLDSYGPDDCEMM